VLTACTVILWEVLSIEAIRIVCQAVRSFAMFMQLSIAAVPIPIHQQCGRTGSLMLSTPGAACAACVPGRAIPGSPRRQIVCAISPVMSDFVLRASPLRQVSSPTSTIVSLYGATGILFARPGILPSGRMQSHFLFTCQRCRDT